MGKKVTILDYGVGNIASLRNALLAVGAQPEIAGDSASLAAAEKIILPGVGAFAPAIRRLRERGLARPLLDRASQGVPLLGICLGMQLLFDYSTEDGRWEGLGLIPGRVVRFKGVPKIPHMGWNAVRVVRADPLLGAPGRSGFFYFVHSYFCEPKDLENVVGISEYGGPFAAAVRRGKGWGVQFHPEKSQHAGLAILRAFVEL